MLTRWLDMDPLRNTTTLRDAMNQLFEHSVVRPNTLPASGFLVPMNMYELDNTYYVVQAYVPGVKPEDVEVTARQNTLSIKGRLPEPISDDRKQRMQPPSLAASGRLESRGKCHCAPDSPGEVIHLLARATTDGQQAGRSCANGWASNIRWHTLAAGKDGAPATAASARTCSTCAGVPSCRRRHARRLEPSPHACREGGPPLPML